MCMTFWSQEFPWNKFSPWRVQWTMLSPWLIWDYWANFLGLWFLNQVLELRYISPSIIHTCWTSSTWSISIQSRLLSFQDLILKKHNPLHWKTKQSIGNLLDVFFIWLILDLIYLIHCVWNKYIWISLITSIGDNKK